MIQKACLGLFGVLIMVLLVLAPAASGSLSDDVIKTNIEVVNETTRYQALNPDKDLTVLSKVKQIKGNYKFTVGKRIDGDHILASTDDDDSYPQALDVQARVKYPRESTGRKITQIEVITDQNTDLIDTFLTEGGADLGDFAEVLLEANSTDRFSYTVTFYGF
ncbi:hypothetical protein ACFFRR_001768 [Megaselia abdita]